MEEILSLWQPEPWNRFTAGLVVAMAFALGLDFRSIWVVTVRLELGTNPPMGWMRWGRRLLTIPTKALQEQGG